MPRRLLERLLADQELGVEPLTKEEYHRRKPGQELGVVPREQIAQCGVVPEGFGSEKALGAGFHLQSFFFRARAVKVDALARMVNEHMPDPRAHMYLAVAKPTLRERFSGTRRFLLQIGATSHQPIEEANRVWKARPKP
jgi:hypothetical protein